MFYEGTLQEGISTAVSQQKLVLCFVTDDSNESQVWENEFLKEESATELIQSEAIALRLTAGSEEAGYLAQIFPLPKTPTVVLIKNGDLKEYITPGTTKDDFLRRIQAAFNKTSQPPAPAAPASPLQGASGSNVTSSSSPPQEQHSSNVQRVLAERAARLQTQKAAAEKKAKEDRAKEVKRAKAEAEAGLDTDRARTLKQKELLKKKKQEEAEERRRILKRIEDDREERKSRALERTEARKSELNVGDVAASLAKAPEEKLPSTTKLGEWTAIQVRLLDGSTMRSRFKTSSTGKDLRKWVDEHRQDGNAPYRFKQILSPLPSRSIDETEEDNDLSALQLAPSSTLVMVPVQSYSNAYDDESSGIFARILAMILGFFTGILGLFQLGGSGQDQEVPTTSSSEEPLARVSSQENEDARRRRGHPLYNGNSTNFEPQPADDVDR